MPTLTFQSTDDTFTASGSEITYKGDGLPNNASGDLCQRAFLVNPASTGNLIVKVDSSVGVDTIQIFQEDDFTAGNPPTGYQKFFNIAKAGKSKGVVAVNVTDATKNYVVILTTPDAYSEISYNGSVVVP